MTTQFMIADGKGYEAAENKVRVSHPLRSPLFLTLG